MELHPDNAMISSDAVTDKFTKGGIDFNPNMLDLQTQGKKADFNAPFDKKTVESIQIDGFSPVIFKIVPTNLPTFMSLTKQEPEQQLTHRN